MAVEELMIFLSNCNRQAEVMLDLKNYDWDYEHLTNVTQTDNDTVVLSDY